MSEHYLPREPAELERIDLSGLHTEGVFTVVQYYEPSTEQASFRVVAGDCTPEPGHEVDRLWFQVVYPGMAVEVWDRPHGRNLTPLIIENDGGVGEVMPRRPHIKRDLKHRDVELRRLLL
jgi:hypothetical protein